MIETTQNLSSLKIKYDCGTDDEGAQVTKSKTYSNVKNDVSAEDLYEVASALANLSVYTATGVTKIDSTVIYETA
jgi:hypothetical protein